VIFLPGSKVFAIIVFPAVVLYSDHFVNVRYFELTSLVMLIKSNQFLTTVVNNITINTKIIHLLLIFCNCISLYSMFNSVSIVESC